MALRAEMGHVATVSWLASVMLTDPASVDCLGTERHRRATECIAQLDCAGVWARRISRICIWGFAGERQAIINAFLLLLVLLLAID